MACIGVQFPTWCKTQEGLLQRATAVYYYSCQRQLTSLGLYISLQKRPPPALNLSVKTTGVLHQVQMSESDAINPQTTAWQVHHMML